MRREATSKRELSQLKGLVIFQDTFSHRYAKEDLHKAQSGIVWEMPRKILRSWEEAGVGLTHTDGGLSQLAFGGQSGKREIPNVR